MFIKNTVIQVYLKNVLLIIGVCSIIIPQLSYSQQLKPGVLHELKQRFDKPGVKPSLTRATTTPVSPSAAAAATAPKTTSASPSSVATATITKTGQSIVTYKRPQPSQQPTMPTPKTTENGTEKTIVVKHSQPAIQAEKYLLEKINAMTFYTILKTLYTINDNAITPSKQVKLWKAYEKLKDNENLSTKQKVKLKREFFKALNEEDWALKPDQKKRVATAYIDKVKTLLQKAKSQAREVYPALIQENLTMVKYTYPKPAKDKPSDKDKAKGGDTPKPLPKKVLGFDTILRKYLDGFFDEDVENQKILEEKIAEVKKLLS